MEYVINYHYTTCPKKVRLFLKGKIYGKNLNINIFFKLT
jgi:hypothetical protein